MVECILFEFSKGDCEYSVDLSDRRVIGLGNGRPELVDLTIHTASGETM